MKTPPFYKIKVTYLTFSLFFLVFAALLYAEDVKVTTYYSAPYGNFKDLDISNTLDAGDSGSPNTPVNIYGRDRTISGKAYKLFSVLNNRIHGWAVGSSGGNLLAEGTLDVRGASNNPILFVDKVNNRVGVGTTTPSATLDVIGDLKSINMAAHMNPRDWTTPWADMYAEVNSSDSISGPTTNAGGARFAATWKPADYKFCYLHVDGAPLVMQSQLKSLTRGLGRGQVAIRGLHYAPPGANNIIFIVGEADLNAYTAAYGPGAIPVVRANGWNAFSSREYKKDIIPLMPMDYRGILEELALKDIYLYRYKHEGENIPQHVGFIAEEAPKDIVGQGDTTIGLQEEVGYLLAAAKALRMEQEDIKTRLERLES